MIFPGAIIFCNSYLNDILQNKLISQLQLNEVITIDEFNNRVAADPNYPDVVHLNKIRILVKMTDFLDQTNRELADVVLYLKAGLARVELNNIGPHGLTLTYDNLYLHKLLRYNDKMA